MPDRQSVIDRLNGIHAVACGLGNDQCYLNGIGIKQLQTLINDATALLKAQEPPTDIAIGNAIFCLQNPHNCLEDEVEEARKMALDAMKALEPIEPVILVRDVNLSNGAKYICGKCGGSFFNQQVNYCPWCGKAVKWGDA